MHVAGSVFFAGLVSHGVCMTLKEFLMTNEGHGVGAKGHCVEVCTRF
jgi:hypothetical protein